MTVDTDMERVAPSIVPLTERLKRLEHYDFGPIVRKLVADGVCTPVEAGVCVAEFRRFVELALRTDLPLAMFSPAVDAFWHQFVLFTPLYREFCREVVGFYFDHVPDTEDTPVDQGAGRNLIESYETRFGDLPAIWYDRLDAESRRFFVSRPIKGVPPHRWSAWPGKAP